MDKKVIIDRYYKSEDGRAALIRCVDHEGIKPVIATYLEKSDRTGNKPVKNNWALDAFGDDGGWANGGGTTGYALVEEIEKPADWDEVPNPAYT